MAKVLRTLSAIALLAVVAAGCGGAARPERSATHGVPPALAQGWEGQASAIATAAEAHDSCGALHLATSLRDDVRKSERRLPLRLRSPLIASVNSLAARIKCTPPATSVPQKPAKPPHERHGEHKHHGHHGHGKGDGGGEDQ